MKAKDRIEHPLFDCTANSLKHPLKYVLRRQVLISTKHELVLRL